MKLLDKIYLFRMRGGKLRWPTLKVILFGKGTFEEFDAANEAETAKRIEKYRTQIDAELGMHELRLVENLKMDVLAAIPEEASHVILTYHTNYVFDATGPFSVSADAYKGDDFLRQDIMRGIDVLGKMQLFSTELCEAVDDSSAMVEVFTKWLSDCWKKAGGDNFPCPIYLQEHDSIYLFDMKAQRWGYTSDVLNAESFGETLSARSAAHMKDESSWAGTGYWLLVTVACLVMLSSQLNGLRVLYMSDRLRVMSIFGVLKALLLIYGFYRVSKQRTVWLFFITIGGLGSGLLRFSSTQSMDAQFENSAYMLMGAVGAIGWWRYRHSKHIGGE